MQHDHASGFEKWLQRRAEKAATSPTVSDRDYQDYVSAMRGEQAQRDAGRVRHLEPGGPDLSEGIPDDRVYQGYLDELSGVAARRRTEEALKAEKIERENEIIRHASEVGGGLSRSHEALRSRLQGFGRPGEGSE